jgi:hypothetical protein
MESEELRARLTNIESKINFIMANLAVDEEDEMDEDKEARLSQERGEDWSEELEEGNKKDETIGKKSGIKIKVKKEKEI